MPVSVGSHEATLFAGERRTTVRDCPGVLPGTFVATTRSDGRHGGARHASEWALPTLCELVAVRESVPATVSSEGTALLPFVH